MKSVRSQFIPLSLSWNTTFTEEVPVLGLQFLSRRRLFRLGVGALAGVTANRLFGRSLSPALCHTTPAQTSGPFYPTSSPPDADVDLTFIEGHSERAAGTVIRVAGQVVDDECNPVPDAIVEIWQANKWGRYHHEADAQNPSPVDPHFQGWAKMTTGADGRYEFKTILPGSYPVDDSGWVRPPHIHFRVARRGHHELITQMYFAGQELNEPDRILQSLSSEEQARVVVDFLILQARCGV
jgi:protocatechuate 3,4-dioxygenase beta subunit